MPNSARLMAGFGACLLIAGRRKGFSRVKSRPSSASHNPMSRKSNPASDDWTSSSSLNSQKPWRLIQSRSYSGS